MDNTELLYIEDAEKRKLFYRFTPAALISNFVPLVVVLDGDEEAPHFEYKMWNVLTPIGKSGLQDGDSCWLGEQGDVFVKDLLQVLIKQIAEEYECEDHIYLYGSGKGGYGAIFHGILCKANAVYAHAPKISAVTTDAIEQGLSDVLNARDTFPIVYLSQNQDAEKSSKENRPEDATAYFADAFKRHGLKVNLDVCMKTQDNEVQALKEVLDFFERVSSEM